MLGEASAADVPAADMPHVPIVMVPVTDLAVPIVAVKAVATDMDLVPPDVVGGAQPAAMPVAVIADRLAFSAPIAVQPLADLVPTAYAQPICADLQNPAPLLIEIGSEADMPIEVGICPVGIPTEPISCADPA